MRARGGSSWTRRPWVALVAALGGVLWSSPSSAADVRWLGAPSCREPIDVAEQVRAMTQRSLDSITSHDFEITVTEHGTGFRLTLRTRARDDGATSERVLESGSCADVTNAVAVAISLIVSNSPQQTEAIEPESTANPPSASPAAPPAPPPIAPPDRPTLPDPRPRASRSVGISAGAGGVVDSSTQPSLAAGGMLWLAATHHLLRLELLAAGHVPTRTRDAAGRGGEFQHMYGAAVACAVRRFARPSGMVCAGYEVGQLSAEGLGVSTPRLQTTLWQAARAELRLAVPLMASLVLMAGAGASLSFTRHGFLLDGSQQVHRPALLSFRGAAGLELVM